MQIQHKQLENFERKPRWWWGIRAYRFRRKLHLLVLRRVNGSWNYFEAGHGKGPCYGVGGCVQRMADEAIRQQKVTIQDASDFLAWMQQDQSLSSVAFSFVSKETCSAAQSEIKKFGELKPVPGTMSIHAVTAIAPGKVITTERSCHCQQCFTNARFNPKWPWLWNQHLLKECPEEAEVVPVFQDWVAAVCDDKWYVAKVLAVDVAEKRCPHIIHARLHKSTGFIKWPNPADKIWMHLHINVFPICYMDRVVI